MRRLTPAFLTLVMFGVVGLLVVAYIAKNLLAVPEQKPQVATRNVPMAVADIPAGTVITENHLGLGPYPVERLDRDMLLVNRVVVGRVAKEVIKAAQPIRANQLYQPGELPPLDVAEGMRAVSVEVGDSVAMVDGMIKPGQYADVLFTYHAAGNADDRFQGGLTMRLFEGVRVIAINRNLTQSRVDRTSNHVTLELTQSQANTLVLAKDRGVITLTYNPNGKGDGGLAVSSAERVTLYEILGLKPREPDKEPFATELYKGSGRGVIYFNDKGRRLDGYGWGGGRNGFDYRALMGAPNGYSGSSSGRFSDSFSLPANPGAAAPAAPSAPSDGGATPPPSADYFPPQPSDLPASRPAPTAARPIPQPN